MKKEMEAFQSFLLEIKEMQDSIFQMKGDLGSYKCENQTMKAKITDIFEELSRVKIENAAIRQRVEAVESKDESETNAVGIMQHENELKTEELEAMTCKDETEKTVMKSVHDENKIEEECAITITVGCHDETEEELPKAMELEDEEGSFERVQLKDEGEELQVVQSKNEINNQLVEFEQSDYKMGNETAEAVQNEDKTEQDTVEVMPRDIETEESLQVDELIDDDKEEFVESVKDGIEVESVERQNESEETLQYEDEIVENGDETVNDSVVAGSDEIENELVRSVQDTNKSEKESTEAVRDKEETKELVVGESFENEIQEQLLGTVECTDEKESEEVLLHKDETEEQLLGSVQDKDETEDLSVKPKQHKNETEEEFVDGGQFGRKSGKQLFKTVRWKDENESGEIVRLKDETEQDSETERAVQDNYETKEVLEPVQNMDETKQESTQQVQHGEESVEGGQFNDDTKKESEVHVHPKVETEEESQGQDKNETKNNSLESVGHEDGAEENAEQLYSEMEQEFGEEVQCEENNDIQAVQIKDETKESSVEMVQFQTESREELIETVRECMEVVKQHDGTREKTSEADQCEDETTAVIYSVKAVQGKDGKSMELIYLRDDGLKCKATRSKQPSTQPDDKLNALDKKVMKIYSKLQRSVNDFKEEYNGEMIKVREDSNKLAQLQRVFNIVHVSLQAKKESGEEKQATASLAPLPPLPTLKEGKHPSKVGISRSDAKKMLDNIKKAAFYVTLKEMPLLCHVAVCIEEYTKVEKQSDFMNPETGIYTIPLQGKYEFRIGRTTSTYKVEIYLCVDRDKRRLDVSSNSQDSNGFYYRTVYVDCEVNDNVWLEAAGRQQGYNDTLSGLVFRGRKML